MQKLSVPATGEAVGAAASGASTKDLMARMGNVEGTPERTAG